MRNTIKGLRKGAEELYIHRRMRGRMKVAAEYIEAVDNAWNDAGPVPEFHEAQKAKLRRSWPTLADALDKGQGK